MAWRSQVSWRARGFRRKRRTRPADRLGGIGWTIPWKRDVWAADDAPVWPRHPAGLHRASQWSSSRSWIVAAAAFRPSPSRRLLCETREQRRVEQLRQHAARALGPLASVGLLQPAVERGEESLLSATNVAGRQPALRPRPSASPWCACVRPVARRGSRRPDAACRDGDRPAGLRARPPCMPGPP